MGKTTDAFTLKLQTLSEQSATLSQEILEASQEVEKSGNLYLSLSDLHTKRSLEIQEEHDQIASKFEPAIATDDIIKKIEVRLLKAGNTLTDARFTRDGAKKKLDGITDDLVAEYQDCPV